MTKREKVNQRMRETMAEYEAMSDKEFASHILDFDVWYRFSFIEIAKAMGYFDLGKFCGYIDLSVYTSYMCEKCRKGEIND